MVAVVAVPGTAVSTATGRRVRFGDTATAARPEESKPGHASCRMRPRPCDNTMEASYELATSCVPLSEPSRVQVVSVELARLCDDADTETDDAAVRVGEA